MSNYYRTKSKEYLLDSQFDYSQEESYNTYYTNPDLEPPLGYGFEIPECETPPISCIKTAQGVVCPPYPPYLDYGIPCPVPGYQGKLPQGNKHGESVFKLIEI